MFIYYFIFILWWFSSQSTWTEQADVQLKCIAVFFCLLTNSLVQLVRSCAYYLALFFSLVFVLFVCIAGNLVLTCSFTSVLPITNLERCFKWGIMRFDDLEPTQLLNGYAPHLDRKCLINCQKTIFPFTCMRKSSRWQNVRKTHTKHFFLLRGFEKKKKFRWVYLWAIERKRN